MAEGCEDVVGVDELLPAPALVLAPLDGIVELELVCGTLLCCLDFSPPTSPPTKAPINKIRTTAQIMSVFRLSVMSFLFETGAAAGFSLNSALTACFSAVSYCGT